MQIGETIRKYRKEKNMTQEEMANRLGVTAPAVNKWENGNSYPDIMMLAPIARLLDISLDTLLSFQGELTAEEIQKFVLKADRYIKEKTYEETFDWVKKTLEKYPNCARLSWQLALILDAQRLFREVPDSEKYDAFIVDCYVRALESKDEDVRYSAADSLYNFYLRKGRYEKAETYLSYFSKQNPERKRKQAAVFYKMGRTQDAYKTYEELLFAEYQIISAVLQGIYMVAMKEKDMEKAKAMVEKQEGLAKLFEMGEYYEVCGRLDLATSQKDRETVLHVAKKMLSGIEHITAFRTSPLYTHMSFKEMDENVIKEMKENLLKSFGDEETYGFMKEEQGWLELIKK